MKKFIIYLFCAFFTFSCIVSGANMISYATNNYPKEMKAVWLTHLGKNSWTSTSGIENQKSELIKQLDLAKSLGINTIYFHASMRHDSLYVSETLPWSEALTGELGKNPSWDPLDFIKKECQKRDLYLEAWINPFFLGTDRTYFNKQSYLKTLPDKNPLKSHNEWIIKASTDWYQLNPGVPEVRKMVVDEACYIAEKYDLNIHIDDYFYPFPEKGKPLLFDDKKEFLRYAKGKTLSDWRRENVNLFIKDLHTNLNKRGYKLSVSPFPIWKNSKKHGGCGTAGLQSFHTIYTDFVKWVKNHWVDCIIPQLYWEIGYKNADYKALATWWNKLVEKTNVKLITGLPAYRLNKNSSSVAFRSPKAIEAQIQLNKNLKNISGYSIFSINSLTSNVLNINEVIKNN